MNKDLLLEMMAALQQRVQFKISLWMTLVSRHLPARCRTKQTNRLLRVADATLARMEHQLDFRNVIRAQDDLQILIDNLLNKKQKWLFQNQRRRFLQKDWQEPDSGCGDKRGIVDLFKWTTADSFDQSLLVGFFNNDPVSVLKTFVPPKEQESRANQSSTEVRNPNLKLV